MIESLIACFQALLVVLLAPLFSGMARVMRAKLQSRQGPGLLQDYHDIGKLFKRPDISSNSSSYIFRLMPIVLLATMVLLAMCLPIITRFAPIPGLGDMITIVYLLALSRFVFVLAALDSSSAFSGAGGIRELVISTLIESAMLLSLMVVALIAGSTDVGVIGAKIASGNVQSVIAVIVAGVAFAFTIYVELGRLPFDLAEAEQELQEGPLTEYSGPSFALVKLGLSVKQIVVISWFIALFLPFGSAAELAPAALIIGLVVFLLKLFVIFMVVSLIENSMTRVRFKLLSQQTWIVVGVSALALIFYIVGL
ncbi:MAG: NADH-quinone oxidoreductase subunit H [Coriobacteriales bacterium]|jgi:hydrogenase-4 component C|nr:NADH-quinone oxidoreductase subunit H [Coriobacteriales bacterium]